MLAFMYAKLSETDALMAMINKIKKSRIFAAKIVLATIFSVYFTPRAIRQYISIILKYDPWYKIAPVCIRTGQRKNEKIENNNMIR